MKRKQGFTLIELLVVVAILVLLAALLFPLLAGAKESAKRTACSANIRQLVMASSLYAQDYEGRYVIAMYALGNGLRQTWFAREVAPGQWNKRGGLLQMYIQEGKLQKCPTSIALPRFGDGNGYGYNWGYIGSDVYITNDWSGWPNLRNPARESDLTNPAEKILFADSGFVNPSWYGGDNLVYETGFIDPPMFWYGNPSIEFRHITLKKEIDEVNRVVTHFGVAVFGWADGHTSVMSPSQVEDRHFTRD